MKTVIDIADPSERKTAEGLLALCGLCGPHGLSNPGNPGGSFGPSGSSGGTGEEDGPALWFLGTEALPLRGDRFRPGDIVVVPVPRSPDDGARLSADLSLPGVTVLPLPFPILLRQAAELLLGAVTRSAVSAVVGGNGGGDGLLRTSRGAGRAERQPDTQDAAGSADAPDLSDTADTRKDESRERAELRERREPESAAVSPDGRSVSWRGQTVRLTPREAGFFRILYENRGRTVAREELLAAAGGGNPDSPRSNLTDVYIGYLRRRLKPLFGDGAILTVRGEGYALRLPQTDSIL